MSSAHSPRVSGRLLLATRSPGKLRELRKMFAGMSLEVVDLEQAGVPPSPAEAEIEHHDTFEENAMAKARHFHVLTGLPTVAEDSGLEVIALGGRPGVRSRRWSGRADLEGAELDEANNRLLLSELQDATDRRARYVCAAAFCEGPAEIVVRGETSGVIAEEPRGSGGFGYDPLFLSDDLGVRFSEVDAEAKESVSHRGRAFRALLSRLVKGSGEGWAGTLVG